MLTQEPVLGTTAGCVTAPAGYFRAIRQVCDRYGVLLVLDEIMCGCTHLLQAVSSANAS